MFVVHGGPIELSEPYLTVSLLQPDDLQTELMHRTATHISSSPNPAQLEMRILANHGGDKRFAFLRGRWSHAWKQMKQKVRVEKAEQEQRTSEQGLGGLVEYGDSDGDSEESEGGKEVPDGNPVPDPKSPVSEAAIKEARRARARAWAEKRRSENAGKS
jgi:hypothetical protein